MYGDLSTILDNYPRLKEALGPSWIREQQETDPVLSRYPIARWLRLPGFQKDLEMLNDVLDRLKEIPGIADRRRRLRADAPSLMETLTELYFGAWLLDRGYRFDWPKKGADFAIDVGTDQPFRIEATTPRQAAWSQDLFERIDLVALRLGYSAELQHYQELLPKEVRPEQVIVDIVQQSLAILETPRNEPIEQPFTQFEQGGVTWTPSDTPGIAEITSPPTTSPYTGFNYVVAAAKAKARQLSGEEAAGLLIGTRDLPMLAWEHFLDALKYYDPSDLQFDWSKLPDQVKHLIFYSLLLRQVNPFDIVWIQNPASSLPDLPGVHEFLRELFPIPLRQDQTVSN